MSENAEQLWGVLEDVLKEYDRHACPCAFPRFNQYTSIDCVDYRGSFYMHETEGLIHYAKPYFHIEPPESNVATYKCKKCGSLYDYEWQDFSIHVSRSYLKLRELKTAQIGADLLEPIPFCVGPSGHKLPPKELFSYMPLDEFRLYLLEQR